MKARSCKYLITAVLAFFAITAGVRADDDADIDQDLTKIEKATSDRDYETLINMMYTPVVQAGGGHDALVSEAKALGDQIDQSSMKSVKPYRHFSGQQNDYALIPTDTIIEMGGTKNEITSAELAIRPHGSNQWQFVDTGAMNPQVRAMFFSDIPADIELPQRSTKLLGSTTPSAKPAPAPSDSTSASSDSPIPDASSESSIAVSPWDKETLHSIYILVGIAGVVGVILIALVITWYCRPKVVTSRPPLERVPPLK